MDVIRISTSQDDHSRLVATATIDGLDQPDYDLNFRTNGAGSGLWIERRTGEWQQVLGTGQFSASNHRQMRERVRRYCERSL
jgi:hypothetical protein